jgi:MFS family permease
MIAIGLTIHTAWYFGLEYFSQYSLLIVASILAGFGAGLVIPAIGAAYVDISSADQRGRIASLKEMVLAIAGMLGPLVAALATDYFPPTYFFRGATVMILLTSGLVVVMAWRYGRRLVGVAASESAVEG